MAAREPGSGAGVPADMDQLYAAQLQATIKREQERKAAWHKLVGDYQSVRATVSDLPRRMRHPVIAPVGKLACFADAELVRTNELLVLLGDNYFVERTAFQTCEIIDRRLAAVRGEIAQSEKELEGLVHRQRATQDVEQDLAPPQDRPVVRQDEDSLLDIREPYDPSVHGEEGDQRNAKPVQATVLERRAPSGPTPAAASAGQPPGTSDPPRALSLMERLEQLEREEEALRAAGMLESSEEEEEEEGEEKGMDDHLFNQIVQSLAAPPSTGQQPAQPVPRAKPAAATAATQPATARIRFQHSEVAAPQPRAVSFDTDSRSDGGTPASTASPAHPADLYRLANKQPASAAAVVEKGCRPDLRGRIHERPSTTKSGEQLEAELDMRAIRSQCAPGEARHYRRMAEQAQAASATSPPSTAAPAPAPAAAPPVVETRKKKPSLFMRRQQGQDTD